MLESFNNAAIIIVYLRWCLEPWAQIAGGGGGGTGGTCLPQRFEGGICLPQYFLPVKNNIICKFVLIYGRDYIF